MFARSSALMAGLAQPVEKFFRVTGKSALSFDLERGSIRCCAEVVPINSGNVLSLSASVVGYGEMTRWTKPC